MLIKGCIHLGCDSKCGTRNVVCSKHKKERAIELDHFLQQRHIGGYKTYWIQWINQEVYCALIPTTFSLPPYLIPNRETPTPLYCLVVPYITGNNFVEHVAVALFCKQGEDYIYIPNDTDRTCDVLTLFGEEYKIITCQGIGRAQSTFAVWGKDTTTYPDGERFICINRYTLQAWDYLLHRPKLSTLLRS